MIKGRRISFARYYYGQAQGNATEAARLAGYTGNDESLARQGSRLLKHPDVIAELKELEAHGSDAPGAPPTRKATLLARDEALTILAAHARGDMADLVNDDGELELAKARTAGKLHLVKSFSKNTWEQEGKDGASNTSVRTRIELHDPQRAIELIAKLEGWNAPDRHQVSLDSIMAQATDPQLQILAGQQGSEVRSSLPAKRTVRVIPPDYQPPAKEAPPEPPKSRKPRI